MKRKLSEWSSVAAIAIFTALGSGQQAHAGFTALGSEYSGEASHKKILKEIYGGKFTASGLNFSNGSVTATRVEDTGAVNDQLWNIGGTVTAEIKAKFAANDQEFGYYDGGTYHSLFDNITGRGYDLGKEKIDLGSALDGKSITWGNGALSSLQSENVGSKDRMITFRIDGLEDGVATWLLAWDDIWKNGKSDWDYQDLVVEIKVRNSPAVIPLPPAAIPGAMTLLGAVALRLGNRFRRRRARSM